MKAQWLNDGEPDENGNYVAIIYNDKGAITSKFSGKSYREVADKLLESQSNANKALERLAKKPDMGRTAMPIQPKELTPDDKFRLAAEITDPNKVVDAVKEIVTAEIGAPPREIGKNIATTERERSNEYYAAEAEAFRKDHPDYYPVAQNRDAIFDELKANGWDLTRNNLAIAYQTLLDREELIPWPEGEDEPPPNGSNGSSNGSPNGSAQPNGASAAANTAREPNTPTPRPRTISTGIRNADASALPPKPPQKARYTRADIERMPRAEYTQRLQSDPDFKRQVDAMGS